MLYPELFSALEEVRWNLADDVSWGAFDGTLLSNEQARTIKMNAITEWSALPALCSAARRRTGEAPLDFADPARLRPPWP
jgi:hypothetical protein